ncbi:MAG TPA: YlxM family DNA-binding protein [Limnochordia bacterium]|nr:YlxM family DNA-binding protein [Limnochordia bacterium]
MIERTLRLNLLFDFYGPLLTAKQQRLFTLYRQEDLSLGEIAEQEGISRQAVHDIIRRAESALEDAEAKCGLAAAHERQRTALAALVRQLSAARDAADAEALAAVEQALRALVNGAAD